MSRVYQSPKIENGDNIKENANDDLKMAATHLNTDSNSTTTDSATIASAVVRATGGTGGSGGSGGHGGNAFNITYVDNYSILALMSTLIPLLTKSDDKVSQDSLLLLKSLMDEQKEYRQEFLEVIKSLRQ